MTRPCLAVIGYASIDEITMPGAPPVFSIGGGAIYAALAAARLGVDVALHVRVGSDFPDTWLGELARLGIDLSAVGRHDGPTRHTRLVYGRDEQRRVSAARDDAWWQATEALRPPLPARAFDGMLLCPVPLDIVESAVASAHGALLVADTSEVFAAGGAAALRSFAGIDVFAPSLAEVHLLSGESDEARAIARLAATVPVLVVKKGRRGLTRTEGGQALDQPVEAIAAVDPTGAGDAAVGALAASLLVGLEPRRQLRSAAAAGRLAVSAPGPAAFGWQI